MDVRNTILVFPRGGEERATGVYKSYMTVAKDDANKAENQKTKGICIVEEDLCVCLINIKNLFIKKRKTLC